MATVEVTEETFEETVNGEGITLLDFWAEWCPPCKAFGPVFEKASEQHPDITFGKIDTEAQQMLAMKFEIRSIPTIMAVRDGLVVYAQPGALPAKSLETLIELVRGLDMEEARAAAKAAGEDEEDAKAPNE
jgi:thioredoxin 1